ncbi:pentapeptide repeat-containing protein [Candidatus Saccharibacteria bacterium]|nr:pentapeptide repeat-containing protein [Candidatus Saccharibacteria bacterium]
MKPIKPTIPPSLSILDNASLLLSNEDSITRVQINSEVLSSDDLDGKSITESVIKSTDLSGVDVSRFDISDCVLKDCSFTVTRLPESSWHRVSIDGGRCSGLQLNNSTLKNVIFTNSKLEFVNFRFSKIEKVAFENCALDDVDFLEAQLKDVRFSNCTINNITFAQARMKNVDLSESTVEGIKGVNSLKGATISHEQLIQLSPYFATEAGIRVK